MKTSRSVEEIQAEILDFDQSFIPPAIPAGTPDRKRLQRETRDEANRRACLPENVERRIFLWQEKRVAERAAKARQVAARRAADPEHQERQRIFRELRLLGFKREYASGKSAYYRRDFVCVRISDHDVPMTPERAHDIANGGFSWSGSSRSFVVGRDDIDEFLASLSERLTEDMK